MSDYIQLSPIRGHVNLDNEIMHKYDFYTICQKNPQNNIGLRKQSKHHHGELVLNSIDVDIDYLCSDFARFCLALYKTKQHLICGEMSLIPKQTIPISKELSEYIREFLPDYYGIRDNVKI
jgi:hypothetical protein